MLRQIVKRREGPELQEQMGQLVDLTVDNIVESKQESEDVFKVEDLMKQVSVIALLTKINPATLSIRKAKQLLPYLRGGSTKADTELLGLLLSIFVDCLPIMPSTALSFAKQLQPLLTPLLNKPLQHFAVLEELIKCYCAVVRWHTHDFNILIKCMQVSYRQLQNIQQGSPSNQSKGMVLMMVTSLLTENADFDLLREDHPECALDINQITPRNVGEEMTARLVSLMDKEALRMPALYSLRYICRTFPKLMTMESTSKMVESILKNGNNQERSAVLSMMEEIMAIESTKFDPDQGIKGRDKRRATREVKVGREELAGTSEALTNPVTFEIVENYIDLVQPLAVEEKLQKQVLEIIQVVVMRGICHPLKCLSTIIALESVTTDKWVSNKAQVLHRHLIHKSNTSINVQNAPHARAAWQFQRKRGGDEVRGCDAGQEALFETWYNTIREQRKTRMELLKSLVKAFDVDTSTGRCSEEDVHYARFVAENLATINYRTVEEVILVTSELQNIITMAGEQVQISVQEEIPVDGEEEQEEEDMDEEESKRAIVIGRMSTIISIALLLRAHVRDQYGLSEDRIARGLEKKASNAAAVRKGAAIVLALDSLPGAWKRKEGVKMAKMEMGVFEELVNSEGMGIDGDDYGVDD